ncbi:hypothetical protein BDM02DRAFT_939005 [Thelephora ganbajun]|uniref:Uncharacterized protein n=1 Tax=Thelephora ganbajun TaxID=370292 RepID=A0ACB6Z4K9_THEGA|nr:hypothetical protein BDM02DRAFT_939005 [Thelephora ganbajun]
MFLNTLRKGGRLATKDPTTAQDLSERGDSRTVTDSQPCWLCSPSNVLRLIESGSARPVLVIKILWIVVLVVASLRILGLVIELIQHAKHGISRPVKALGSLPMSAKRKRSIAFALGPRLVGLCCAYHSVGLGEAISQCSSPVYIGRAQVSLGRWTWRLPELTPLGK